jgi:hypothetical protein
LFRLVILLALVLLLMREAADPQVYRNFFAAVGAPLAAEMAPQQIANPSITSIPSPSTVPGDGQHVTPDANRTVANSLGETARVTVNRHAEGEKVADFAPDNFAAIVAQLGADGVDRLSRYLATRRRTPQNDETASTAPDATLISMLDSASAATEMPSADWSSILRGPDGDAVRGEFQSALDRRYLTAVSDATIWMPQDANAFYRWLEIGTDAAMEGKGPAVNVGFVSLLDQPAVYRGQRVALVGQTVRVEAVPAAENPFGVQRYWLVWVRPEDGSERPVMGYCVDLPPQLDEIPATGVTSDGPRVILDGVFLRRHLYQSSKGSELSPVIVGQVRMFDTEPAPTASLALQNGSTLGGRMLWLIGIAAMVGMGSTVAIAWYTARVGRWRRQLRVRGLSNPAEFLSQNVTTDDRPPTVAGTDPQ